MKTSPLGRTSIVLLALSPLASACAAHAIDVPPILSATSMSLTTHSAENPGASFETYRTFSFDPSEGTQGGNTMSPRSQEVQQRLTTLITGTLIEKGYRPAAAGRGDFVVVFSSGTRGTRDLSSPGASRGSFGWVPDNENADFVDGSIVIDAFDGAQGQWVWHGASQALMNPDSNDQERLDHAVRDLLGSFPKAGSRLAAPTP